MNRLLLLVFFLGLFTTTQAQNPDKLVKKANRLLGNYRLDQANNYDKLAEAKDLVTEAFATGEVDGDTKAQFTKAEIFAAVAQYQINAAILDESKLAEINYSNLPMAFQAYKQSLALAEKNFRIREIVDAMKEYEPILENAGILALQNQKFDQGYKILSSLLESGEILRERGEETVLDMDITLDDGTTYKKEEDIISYALTAGVQPNVDSDVESILKMAIDKQIQDATVYQVAYQYYKDTDKEKALSYLDQGIQMFPNDNGLLFAQINAYIEDGNLEGLIDKLKIAIEKEPDNASVYATLGNVYDQLFSKANKEGDKEKAAEYFENALKYYKESTEVDPTSFNSYYGIGALYFNKAANVAQEMNSLDLNENEKYKKLETEMMTLYEESFPYLTKAEELNPADPLVLTALKEYHARMDNFEKSNEYKAKLEALKK